MREPSAFQVLRRRPAKTLGLLSTVSATYILGSSGYSILESVRLKRLVREDLRGVLGESGFAAGTYVCMSPALKVTSLVLSLDSVTDRSISCWPLVLATAGGGAVTSAVPSTSLSDLTCMSGSRVVTSPTCHTLIRCVKRSIPLEIQESSDLAETTSFLTLAMSLSMAIKLPWSRTMSVFSVFSSWAMLSSVSSMLFNWLWTATVVTVFATILDFSMWLSPFRVVVSALSDTTFALVDWRSDQLYVASSLMLLMSVFICTNSPLRADMDDCSRTN